MTTKESVIMVAPNSNINTNNATREIAKELSFEDISVHSPGMFRKGDAMRALRENPSVGTLRTALQELNATSDSFERILENAKDMMGNSQQDLERIKTNIKRLKFGTIELSTEQAFLRSILESRPLPQQPPVESEDFKARNAKLKALKDANDADEKVVEALVETVGEGAAAFAAEHAALTLQVEALDALEAAAEAAELAGAGVSADALPDPADDHLSTDDARALLEALDAEVRVLSAQVKSRENEAAAMKSALEPDEAALASVKAEVAVTFHPGSTSAVKSASLEPADVPIDDVVAAAKAGLGGAEDVLRNLVCETRVRVAATAARAECLAAAASQTPLEWSPSKSHVLVRLYGGVGGGVAAVDVPLEWPLNGARVRVVGLAGLAPAVVASAAQRVEPGGYLSLAAALRATQDALAAAGHFPPML